MSIIDSLFPYNDLVLTMEGTAGLADMVDYSPSSTEPTWPTSGTVTDGTVVWTYIEKLTDPISLGPKVPS